MGRAARQPSTRGAVGVRLVYRVLRRDGLALCGLDQEQRPCGTHRESVAPGAVLGWGAKGSCVGMWPWAELEFGAGRAGLMAPTCPVVREALRLLGGDVDPERCRRL